MVDPPLLIFPFAAFSFAAFSKASQSTPSWLMNLESSDAMTAFLIEVEILS